MYQTINIDILQQIVENHLGDFTDYTKQILKFWKRGFMMEYKIRVYDLHTNKETIKLDEVFETKDEAEAAIEKLELQYPEKYEYVKVPVKN